MAMTRREMMLRTLAGKSTPSLPWAPRLDLWYLANKRAGTLPGKFRDASLIELVDEMRWGYHAIVPNFKDLRGELDEADREFDRFAAGLFAELGDGRGQIMGISDTTPPAARWERLVRVGEMARDFGAVVGRGIV